MYFSLKLFLALTVYSSMLNISTINLRGISTLRSRQEKLEVLKSIKSDILFVQELWLRTNDDVNNVKSMWMNGHSEFSIGSDKCDGVGILFNTKDVIITKKRELIPGRLLVLDCILKKQKIRLINMYTSQIWKEKEQLFNRLKEVMCGQYEIILAGDTNCITEANDRIPTVPFKSNRASKMLKDTCEAFNMKDAFRTLHPNAVGYTRFDTRSKTRIDRIYVSKNIRVRSYSTEAWHQKADHLAVRASIFLPHSVRQQSSWQLNVNCLKDVDTLHSIREEIRRVKDLRAFTSSSAELWEEMKRSLKRHLIHRCKSLHIKQNNDYNELMKAYIDIKCIQVDLLTDSDVQQLEEITEKLANFNNEYIDKVKFHAGLESDDPVSINKIIQKYKQKTEQKCISSLRNKDGKIVHDSKGIKQVIVDNLKDVYGNVTSNPLETEAFLSRTSLGTVGDAPELLGPVTSQEIEIAISLLSRSKSAGPDGLSAEIYQAFPSEFSDILSAVFNESITAKCPMHDSLYQGLVSLIFKKGDPNDINNYRQITLTNMDYKIFAKIIMLRMSNVLERIIEQEQSCAIKGRTMWNNLSKIREMIAAPEGEKENFFIVGFDQKRAFDFIDREYVWSVLQKYGFPQEFIDYIKLLYADSRVAVKVNGGQTEYIKLSSGLKQGCPLSAALYVISISPLLNRIKKDLRLSGVKLHRVLLKVSAYADDVTCNIKNQRELDIVRSLFHRYEQASGARLNDSKTECIWIGSESERPSLSIPVGKEMRILGIHFSNQDFVQKNWQRKEDEIKEEIDKWKNRVFDYNSKINIIKTFILPKLMFLANILPPPANCMVKINKMCVSFIWGSKREVAKRALMFKNSLCGGLGAMDITLKLDIAYCKNIAKGIRDKATWVGEPGEWEKTSRRSKFAVEHKVRYAILQKKYSELQINWSTQTSKQIYHQISDHLYGGLVIYDGLSENKTKRLIKYLNSDLIVRKTRDTMWLTVNGKLPVRHVLRHISDRTVTCPMPSCNQVETINHCIFECDRAKQVWQELRHIGITVPCDPVILQANFDSTNDNTHKLLFLCISITVSRLWTSRCQWAMNSIPTDSNKVFKSVRTELRRRKTIDLRRNHPHFNWDTILI